MKRLIIIILVLLVVASGGAAGLVMLGVVHNPFQKPGANDAAKAAAEAAAAAESSNGFKPPTEVMQMVKMPDMIVPVIRDGRLEHRIAITLRFVTTAGNKSTVQSELRQFQNDFLADLITYFPDYFERHDIVDVEAVKQKAAKHAAQVFGDDVTNVLLVNVFETGASSGAKSGLGAADE